MYLQRCFGGPLYPTTIFPICGHLGAISFIKKKNLVRSAQEFLPECCTPRCSIRIWVRRRIVCAIEIAKDETHMSCISMSGGGAKFIRDLVLQARKEKQKDTGQGRADIPCRRFRCGRWRGSRHRGRAGLARSCVANISR